MARTRIAPSPTGQDMHIGTVYTALINFAVAKKNKGNFIVRIEDTDRTRYVEGSEQRMLSSLTQFGITHDEGPDNGGPYGPYRQSDRLELYKNYAQELISKGRAYYCFCTKERLEQLREKQIQQKQLPRYDKYCLTYVTDAFERIQKGETYVIRLDVKPNKKIWFDDVLRGRIEFDSNGIDDQILMKSDGYPTYHLAVVVDDFSMKITHVIRAEEWISSTPKHVMLYESFGWPLPTFAHVPILRNPDKSKMSKRKNPVWASWYIEQGFLPQAVINYLALMGWSHPKQKEIFSLDEFISVFELFDMQTVGPIFDIKKLEWMNGVYIREKLSNEELVDSLKRFYKDDPFVLDVLKSSKGQSLIDLARTRMKTLKDFKELLLTSEPRLLSEKEKDLAKSLREIFLTLHVWEEEKLLETLKVFSAEKQIPMKTIYMLITGKPQGLPLPQTMVAYGKDFILDRLTVQ